MAIVVFSELGGEHFLGRARELADETGDRVIALCSSSDLMKQQRLIYLGADEVLVCHVEALGEWSNVVAQYLGMQENVRILIFPSTPIANLLMGLVYGEVASRITPYMEAAEVLTGDGAGKKLENSVVLQKSFVPDKTALVSVARSTVADPFEDPSRFGKIRDFEVEGDRKQFVVPSDLISASNHLLILTGPAVKDPILELANRVAEKFGGSAKQLSGKVEVVYAPCLAIEVPTKLRELPEFKGELISISTKKEPISTIAEISLVTPDIEKILENLTR